MVMLVLFEIKYYKFLVSEKWGSFIGSFIICFPLSHPMMCLPCINFVFVFFKPLYVTPYVVIKPVAHLEQLSWIFLPENSVNNC